MVQGQLVIHMQKCDVETVPHIMHKNYTKWPTDQNAKTIKVFEESIRVNLHDLRLSSGFLDMISKSISERKKYR